MATLTVGGKEYNVPEMNFLAVERAWPHVVEATAAFDPMKGSAAAIAVIAAAMFEGENFNREEWGIDADVPNDLAYQNLITIIKRRMKATEISSAKDTMLKILEEGGLQVSEGELLESLGLVESLPDLPSPETAEDTSQSLSQQE